MAARHAVSWLNLHHSQLGASTRSVVCFFLSCVLLVFSPVLCGVLALIAASYRSSLAFILTPVRQAVSANPALVGSFYVYWIAFCIYILYSAHPHSLNVVKYQMFSIPWKYRRDHVSHMRLDRLRRAWPPSLTPGNTPKSTGTIALPRPIYLMGLWRPLRASETMASLGIRGLCHFTMLPRLRGGAPGSMSVREDGTVVNEHGWEQGALNPDGSSKSAEDIDFGQDPGTPPPAASESTRPKRGEDKQARFKAALEIEAEDSDSGQQPRKKRKAVSRSRRSAKGKDKETLSEAEDSVYVRSGSDSDSDSDPDATITHEELAAGLPSKTIPSGTGRRPRDSGSKRNRKKQKPNQASDGPSNLANSPSIAPTTSANTAEDSGEKPGKRESPMYLFWEEIKKSDDNKKGDRFFRCRHGDSKKELKMTKAGKGSFTGLIGHMKTHAPDMYRFYEILNGKYKIVGLTEQEIAIAEGRKVFVDRKDFNHFLNSYTGATHQQTLRESLERAAEKSVVSSYTLVSPLSD
ncbi:hypothetical protein B0H14DRAFT_2583118 [Mycena olivaceomarginata]|nr:hypothetical protein B0H14DRAFT_2583118 [Mycena olivaceomarginata]